MLCTDIGTRREGERTRMKFFKKHWLMKDQITADLAIIHVMKTL